MRRMDFFTALALTICLMKAFRGPQKLFARTALGFILAASLLARLEASPLATLAGVLALAGWSLFVVMEGYYFTWAVARTHRL